MVVREARLGLGEAIIGAPLADVVAVDGELEGEAATERAGTWRLEPQHVSDPLPRDITRWRGVKCRIVEREGAALHESDKHGP